MKKRKDLRVEKMYRKMDLIFQKKIWKILKKRKKF